jgi:hypothetical protein
MSSDQQVVPALSHRCYARPAQIPHPPHIWYSQDWWNEHDDAAPLVIGVWYCDGWLGEADDFGPFSDSPQLGAVREAIEGLPVGTEGQVLTRAFSETIAAAACRAMHAPSCR